MGLVAKSTKTQRVRSLLQTTSMSASEIATVTGASYALCTAARRKMRLDISRDILPGKVAKLERDAREMRRRLLRLESVISASLQN